MQFLNLRHSPQSACHWFVIFSCDPLLLSHFSLPSLQTGSKFAACLLDRPPLSGQTGRKRHAASGMMNGELISGTQKAARHAANPVQLTAYLNLPVCVHLFTAVSLILCCLCPALSLTAWLCFCCYSRLHLHCTVCISVFWTCRGALVPRRHISSVRHFTHQCL